MAQEPFYAKSVELFANYPIGVEMVGEPYKEKRLFVQDINRNWTDGMNARLLIEIIGKKKTAIIHSWSHKEGTPAEWRVDKCDLEIDKKRWTFYINPSSKDTFAITNLEENQQEYPQGWIKSEFTRQRLGVDIEEVESASK